MANSVVPARGMRDIVPADKSNRDRILGIILETYRRAGFAQIETPSVEPLSRLLSNQGGENEKMIFEIMKRGLPCDQPVFARDAADLGLRYDLTVPLTRFYASHAAELPRVFRALQTGPVWRAERPQKGRYRQFIQCDIDIIGDPSIVSEVDLVTTTLKAFEALGMASDVKLLINDRHILLDMLSAFGVAEETSGDVLIALDKADKIGTDGVRSELLSKSLMKEDEADRLLELVTALSDPQAAEEALKQRTIKVDSGNDVSLRELPEIVAAVRELVPWAQVQFDATLVRGMGYYTGPIFEVTHKDRDFSVAGGGRYDQVVGRWLGREVPACGFSIGFERIIDLVDLPDSGGDRVALLYKPGCDTASLLRLRANLLASGVESVSLVVPPRRLTAQFFDGLKEDRYTHFLDGRKEDASLEALRTV